MNITQLPFLNRKHELSVLDSWLLSAARLAVIHGRRRLGKTSLLREWVGRQPGSRYILATEGTPVAQRAAFAEDLEETIPDFSEVAYPTWRALFRALAAQWPTSAPRRALLIDELPYLAATSPEISSVLQGFIDDPTAQHVPLVLCGSSQRMMQGLVLDRSAPLYGRAECLLRLTPLHPAELTALPGVETACDIVRNYAVWGGVPRYWELAALSPAETLWERLQALALTPSGVLYEEASRVLRDEETAALERAACQAIGRGASRPSEISGRLGAPSTTLSKPLRHLIELGLVRRDAPYDFARGRSAENTRSAIYTIADPFLAFWHACVSPYRSGLELSAESALAHVREALRHHTAAQWEQLVRAQWHSLALNDLPWETAGRYWKGRKCGGSEWDVVSITTDRRHILLGECKWHDSISERDVLRFAHQLSVKERPAVMPDADPLLALFIPDSTGFPREVDGVRVFDAADVVG